MLAEPGAVAAGQTANFGGDKHAAVHLPEADTAPDIRMGLAAANVGNGGRFMLSHK